MSYDDGPHGRVDEQDRADEALSWRASRALQAVVFRLRSHAREWPGRYVDQQATLYESE